MRLVVAGLVVALTSSLARAEQNNTFDEAATNRFAELALGCVHQEYPNKISHVMNSAADAKPPQVLTPVFFGCFDWHSAVHGHWLLVRLCRMYPHAPFVDQARNALGSSFTAEKIAGELAYIRTDGRATFERPYGLAWLLQLSADLREWDDPQAQQWAALLEPLEQEVAARFKTWLPKLSHPVRTGEHSQTAFALGLVLDWARSRQDEQMATLVVQRARDYYLADRAANLSFEPDGQAFLSPILAEADLMRRVLSPAEFSAWLDAFLPALKSGGSKRWLPPVVVTDKQDGHLVHLDGLNLSRAWMLEGIAVGLEKGDPRIEIVMDAADQHRQAGLRAVSGEHYEGGHWLGSFAVYLTTKRGL